VKTVEIVFPQERHGGVDETADETDRELLLTDARDWGVKHLLLFAPLPTSFEYLSPAESVHPPIDSMTLTSVDFGVVDTSLS